MGELLRTRLRFVVRLSPGAFVLRPERGCVEDQPQQFEARHSEKLKRASKTLPLRLVFDTAALRA